MSRMNIKKIITDNIVVIILQAMGLIVLIGNVWIATKISPLAISINQITSRVSAIEKRNETTDVLIPRFLQLEERDIHLVEDIKEIKSDIKDIKEFLNIR